LKASIRLPISDQYQPRPYLALLSHNTPITEDDGRQPCKTPAALL